MLLADKYHRETLAKIMKEGYMDENPRPRWEDGTPAHTLSINHNIQRYDLAAGEFPITTLRPLAWKSSVKEIFWIYQMQSNKLQDLRDMGVKYWDQWDIGDGTIGCRYGETVRKHDQMNKLLNGLEKDPFGRRHVINMWQEDDFHDETGGTTKGLNPCCYETIWNVRKGTDPETGEPIRYLDMLMNQRSSDYAVSNTINELQYVALQMMVAKHLSRSDAWGGIKCVPGVFTHVSENVQIYDRHMEQAKELIGRESVDCNPYLALNVPDGTNFYQMRPEDFSMIDLPVKQIAEENPQLPFEVAI